MRWEWANSLTSHIGVGLLLILSQGIPEPLYKNRLISPALSLLLIATLGLGGVKKTQLWNIFYTF